MASTSQIPRDDKRRIAGQIHDNLAARAANGPADSLLDPFIAKSAVVRDGLTIQVDAKSAANAERAALLVRNDRDDDDVDRWYRHVYRYLEAESLRRHAPEHAAIKALLDAAYPDGLARIDDRIPDQNEEVRKTLVALRNPEVAGTLAAIQFPTGWLDALDSAVQTSDASFAAYRAAIGDGSSAVALGRNVEDDWVDWARALTHAMALRSSGAGIDVVEEGKRLMAPLTDAMRLLRTQAKTRATKKKAAPDPTTP